MNKMSNLDVYAISKELQALVGYKVDNIYRDSSDSFYLFKFKGFGSLKNPILLIEPGIRFYLTEYKYEVPQRPTDKIMAVRKHLKGSELVKIRQVEFDRIIEMTLVGKQKYRVYVELFGTRPNFIIVGEENKVILALWYRKMRHRDLLPGKEFELPPSSGKSIFQVDFEEFKSNLISDENQNEEVVRVLVRKFGGGGGLMEEILYRAGILKSTPCAEITEKEIMTFLSVVKEFNKELMDLNPSVILDIEKKPVSYQPITLRSVDGLLKRFDTFSAAMDYYYSTILPQISTNFVSIDRKRKKILAIKEKQEKAIKEFTEKEMRYKLLGDRIYENFSLIDDLLNTIYQARKKNISWEEIMKKFETAGNHNFPSLKIFKEIVPEKGKVVLIFDSEEIEVDFRKSASTIANEFYENAKKITKKIVPAHEALEKTIEKLNNLSMELSIQKETASLSLKRRKRKWYEKYHWTYSKNNFLIIGGKDISGNEEIAKRRLNDVDLFFHAELQGAPYTILIRESNDYDPTEEDIKSAARLAACFSSGWKVGFGAVDVYYVTGSSVSFSAPSGEYIPKGGVMVRGPRTYIRGVELILAIGIEFDEHYARVIYGTEERIKKISPNYVMIKPGPEPKGKLAKHIQKIFIEKANSPEEQAKIRAIDLNEFVHAIPHNSVIYNVFFSTLV